MSSTDVREVIIIGGGPAGYTAALYSARANLKPLVIEGFAWGGQLMITSDVENYPGYAEGVLGPEMMRDFRKQAERFGAEFVTDDVTRVDFSEQPFRIWVGDDEYRAESVIVSTGATARQLGLPSERTLQGRGVSYCAVCDAAFFGDKRVIVVGGGDSAMEEAVFLAKFASSVTVVHRRDEFRASPIMLDRARANEKISFVLNSVVDEVIGEGKVTAVRLQDVRTGETTDVEADGLFVAIGHDPNTALFLDQLDHDDAGYLVTRPGSTATNVDGVFAVGDVVDHVYRQAITAAGSGCMGALDAERWLAGARGPRGHAAPGNRSGSSPAPRRYDRRRNAVLHLPELQGALDRPRRSRGAHRPGRPVRTLRVRLPLRADGRLLPGADDRVRRLRPGRPHPRERARRLRADRLLRGRPDRHGRRCRRSGSPAGEDGKNPAELSLEWGVRRLGEHLELRTHAGTHKRVTADFFPAYDDDGGLLIALTPV